MAAVLIARHMSHQLILNESANTKTASNINTKTASNTNTKTASNINTKTASNTYKLIGKLFICECPDNCNTCYKHMNRYLYF